MKSFLKISLILLWINVTNPSDNIPGILSRKRRLVAFPEGSSISVAAAIHIGILGAPFNHGHMGIVWGASYELPNETWVLDRLHSYKFSRPNMNENEFEMIVKRRSRRDLYGKLEVIIDNIGFNGRACMLRTLCESINYFPKQRDNMIFELLKTLFNFPIIDNQNEPNDIIQYSRAIEHGQQNENNCLKYYHKCKISILDHLIGNN